jgi:hypothetical protein
MKFWNYTWTDKSFSKFCPFHIAFGLHSFQYARLFTALSPPCSQRGGGLAQRRLPQTFGRATNVQVRTTFSAGLLPPLRQTARWLSGLLYSSHFVIHFQFTTIQV